MFEILKVVSATISVLAVGSLWLAGMFALGFKANDFLENLGLPKFVCFAAYFTIALSAFALPVVIGSMVFK